MESNLVRIGRRGSSRLRLGIDAKLDLIGGKRPCVLIDISATGVRLSLNNPPKPGECAVLQIENIEAFGTVVWRNSNCCGIRFDKSIREGALIQLRQSSSTSVQAERLETLEFAQKWAQGR